MLNKNLFPIAIFFLSLLLSCSVSKQISRKAENLILKDSLFRDCHVGIALFDPVQNKMLYAYQAEKYFVPASNVKIATCYAVMKWLGKELPGMRYLETDTALVLVPTGDPTLLHQDFITHPVIEFLTKTQKKLYITDQHWQDHPLGNGWSWSDYNDSYMAERSALPVYGNTIRWSQVRSKKENPQNNADTIDSYVYAEPDITWEVNFKAPQHTQQFTVKRNRDKNVFTITEGLPRSNKLEVPFVTDVLQSAISLLRDTIHHEIFQINPEPGPTVPESLNAHAIPAPGLQTIYSHPTDSLLKLMMHRSDNFFAEQSLLMVSNEILGVMNDDKIIDKLLNSELNGFPQKPRWIDGSGLSRYNLFTPNDFVWLLTKMKNDFDWDRLKAIFPTGGMGTLKNFYRQDSGFIFAKTGTLSGTVSLSGYIITQKNLTLIFSVLVNSTRSNTNALRRKLEELFSFIRKNY